MVLVPPEYPNIQMTYKSLQKSDSNQLGDLDSTIALMTLILGLTNEMIALINATTTFENKVIQAFRSKFDFEISGRNMSGLLEIYLEYCQR